MDDNFQYFILDDLKSKKQWVGWNAIWDDKKDKYKKIPINPNTGHPAQTTDESTWDTFDVAVQAVSKYDLTGIGFVFTKNTGIVGIDIDHCRDPQTGKLSDIASDIIQTINSYAEISPSGTGIHILAKGKLPALGRKNQSLGLEMYDSGRYFTVTGKHIPGTPVVVNDAEKAITSVHEKYIDNSKSSDASVVNKSPNISLQINPTNPTDDELIKKAMGFQNGQKFSRLWNGDWKGSYGSQSEADLTLCGFLAFLTGSDSYRMDSLFRQSGLFRKKWDEIHDAAGHTYGQLTIEKAIENCHSYYTPNTFKQTNSLDKIDGNKDIVITSDPALTQSFDDDDAIPWPNDIEDAAFYGPAGDFVRLVDPCTEASLAALLINFLISFGNVIGRKAHFTVGAKKHYLNLFGVLVGISAKSRKGTSWSWIEQLFSGIDENWVNNNIVSGLSSGEGLIFRVKDAVYKQEPIKNTITNRVTGYKQVVAEPGVTDKRILVSEEEFVNALKVMKREGNILSPICRMAWDGGNLQILTKNSPLKASGAHISILGHITKDELKLQLKEIELLNGLANRFLWFCVRKSKTLPSPGFPDKYQFKALSKRISKAKAFAENTTEIIRDPEVEAEWCRISTDESVPKGIYQILSSDSAGITATILSRAEAQVMRLACIYALLDQSAVIHMQHMNAALAVWRYNVESVKYIFGDGNNYDRISLKILEALKQSKSMSQSQMYKQVFCCNVESKKLKDALQELSARGKIKCIKQSSGTGRPSKIWMIV